MFHKLSILWNAFIGYMIKWKIDYLGCGTLPLLKNNEVINSPNLIVSLTSYGRRVSSGVVYYTLISLLKQTKTPNRIILWLADNEWNDEISPPRLKSLRKCGIEIKYCDDIRSYKKLIPTLLEFPDDIILTVDDDIYYSSRLVERLHSAFLHDKNKIYCTKALTPSFNRDGTIKPYKLWVSPSKSKFNSHFLLPIGAGGILYPPKSLYNDTCKKDLFTNLCPSADDLWFWIMALKQETERCQVSDNIGKNYSFDNLYQYFHKGSALTHTNKNDGNNDCQIAKVLKYYGLTLSRDIHST